jgi:hypothetical protein
MKTLITLSILLITSIAFATDTTLVFTMTSSAATATPNLRISLMKRVMVQAPIAVQSFVRDETVNYYLTKTKTVTYSGINYLGAVIEAPQDTKVYRNGDLTNYMLLQADGSILEMFRP